MTAPVGGRWTPGAFTRARGVALQGRIPTAFGTAIAVDGEATQKPVPPAVAAFAAWVGALPGFRSGGTRRSPAKPSTAGRVRDVHEEGRAVDAMVLDPASSEGIAAGTRLVEFVVENADALRVQGVIWRGTEWYASRSGPAWEDYDGADAHTSHPHVEFSPDVLSWSAADMNAAIARALANPARPASSGFPWGALLAGGATVALAWWGARRWRTS